MVPRPSILIEQRVQPFHERKDLGARCVAAMVLFRNRFDGLHHIGETSTTLTAFAERMVDFSGHDELPAVLIEERQDGVLDFLLADIVAMTDDHCGSPNQAKTHTGDRLRA
jgi:hypothetical protein